MNITALLNPTQETRLRRRSTTTTRNLALDEADYTPESFSTLRKGKSKPAKDTPKYEVGPVKGEVRYPPHIITDSYILKMLEKHNIMPALHRLQDMPQSIPYSSDKKEFSVKTARDGFEGTSNLDLVYFDSLIALSLHLRVQAQCRKR